LDFTCEPFERWPVKLLIGLEILSGVVFRILAEGGVPSSISGKPGNCGRRKPRAEREEPRGTHLSSAITEPVAAIALPSCATASIQADFTRGSPAATAFPAQACKCPSCARNCSSSARE
jgi:hypothetical protein